ncbi:21057_t:CDS:2 [Rhizophagus irregularis]|nr:21057_t:CDS:2 [Rhizophagus irregularis]
MTKSTKFIQLNNTNNTKEILNIFARLLGWRKRAYYHTGNNDISIKLFNENFIVATYNSLMDAYNRCGYSYDVLHVIPW